jgi:branched-chain amino acid transport system substrate-binding protein
MSRFSQRPARWRAAVGCALVATALSIAGCGGGAHSGHKGHAAPGPSNVVDVYSDLPLHGPDAAQAAAINDGIELSLDRANHRAGQFTIDFREFDDSSTTSDGWDPVKTESNARKVATNPRAIFYIGDYNSGANELSIPILNEAGIAQVSPSATYVGLTADEPGALSGEPYNYYPTGKRTFFRLVPRGTLEAGADLEVMRDSRCTRVAIANDDESYGKALAELIGDWHTAYGIDIVGRTRTVGSSPAADAAYAATLKGQGIDCFEFAGLLRNGGVAITEDVHRVLPAARIFAPSSLCTSAWTNATHGGVTAAVDPDLHCTLPTLGISGYTHGNAYAQSFVAAYKLRYGSDPDPYLLYGYEAMQLGVDTIDKLGARGDDRAAVVSALMAIRNRRSVLGTYQFDSDGDSDLRYYGLYRVDKHHDPVYQKAVFAKALPFPLAVP